MKLPKETLSKLSLFSTQLAHAKTSEDLMAIVTNLISDTAEYHGLRTVDDSFRYLNIGDWVSMVFDDESDSDDLSEVVAMVIKEDEYDLFYIVLVLDPESSTGGQSNETHPRSLCPKSNDRLGSFLPHSQGNRS